MTDQKGTELGVAGVPQDAMRRLAELQPGRPGSIFTSDLSVNEFLLVREAGFRPLGLVLGSSIYHVGLQVGRWGKNQELDVLSQAMYHARELAMTRMEAEADALGRTASSGSGWTWRSRSSATTSPSSSPSGPRSRPRRARAAAGSPTGATTRTSRSPPTCPGRTSGPSSGPVTRRSAW